MRRFIVELGLFRIDVEDGENELHAADRLGRELARALSGPGEGVGMTVRPDEEGASPNLFYVSGEKVAGRYASLERSGAEDMRARKIEALAKARERYGDLYKQIKSETRKEQRNGKN